MHMAHRYVDIGVNLDHRRFERDRDEVVDRARDAGVSDLILTGTSHESSRRAAALATRYEQFSTAGVHPHDAAGFETNGGGPALEALLDAPSVVAVGECGLDFDRDFSPRGVQETVFRTQLRLAQARNLPVFFHERKAHERFCAILDETGPVQGVVHCFTGERSELRVYLERGFYIGVTGWICDERRGQHLLELVGEIPPGRLLIETDAPFLTPRTLRPRPKKGRNEPSLLPHIAEVVAMARGESLADLAEHTSAAAEALFGLEAARSRKPALV
ncbi:MAG: TatD family hydrolase [Polyangiales bacterium]